jgi:hypothetical protein
MAAEIQKRQRAQLFNTTKELKLCIMVRGGLVPAFPHFIAQF